MRPHHANQILESCSRCDRYWWWHGFYWQGAFTSCTILFPWRPLVKLSRGKCNVVGKDRATFGIARIPIIVTIECRGRCLKAIVWPLLFVVVALTRCIDIFTRFWQRRKGREGSCLGSADQSGRQWWGRERAERRELPAAGNGASCRDRCGRRRQHLFAQLNAVWRRVQEQVANGGQGEVVFRVVRGRRRGMRARGGQRMVHFYLYL
ncbi:hypothetical protein BC828DRAFT_70224 [Blastocladiella britannica]|nr:hypothetical protein BC828DRAFT_70224 [Blastocladiella britannica]